ncbi:tRNA(fMet)-specific endonuclease VapC [Methanobrevibacter cuticularis]|uniref:tRNA(FMet)-specific endonuclease VapC n=1 Tax=Methanobrevibacter cuticularis TaxID=47311 RepID=A0A166E750_9EURY|nr:ribonuclease VapC [Methanobrevibacter cuticularis]KZX16351.1 tRNA(fMet)-specific endonuclease VapC [Methanobrevibacter cuticularis]
MGEIYYILDASAFIGGFDIQNSLNFTISEISEEVKDLKSKLIFDEAINNGKLFIKEPSSEGIKSLESIISNSGDILRLSMPDKKLIALAIEFFNEKKNVEVITDDYSIQNVLKILKIPYKSILTEGIKGIYNWKKTCEGCKKEYPDSYSWDDCEICGSKIFKKRIKKD